MNSFGEKLILGSYPQINSNELGRIFTMSFQNADLMTRLSTDQQINFALQPLLYSFNLDIAKISIETLSRWLINPNLPDAILDVERYNKYIQIVFNSIPIIYSTKPQHRDDVLEATHRFLRDTITPDDSKKGKAGHPFNPTTWNVALTCLVNSIHSTNRPPTQITPLDTKIRNNLMSLFVDGFLIADLEISNADNLIHNFCSLCYFNRGNDVKGPHKKDDASHWNDLFRGFFEMFINFPNDSKRRYFIVNVIARMKFRAKTADEEFLKVTRPVSDRCPILPDFFDIALKSMKKHFITMDKMSLFKQKAPGDDMMRMFSDGVIIVNLYPSNVLKHFRNIFSIFTWGKFAPNSPWLDILTRYLGAFLVGSSGKFINIYAFLNTAHNFISERPKILGEIIDPLISAALQVPLTAPTNLPKDFQLLYNGDWTHLFANALELARADGNAELEARINNMVENFVIIPIGNLGEDFAVYKLMLLAIAGNENLFATSFCTMKIDTQVYHREIVWDFEMLTLALSPYYMPNIAPTLQNCSVLECLLNFVEQKPSHSHILSFMLALIEIAKRTDYFLNSRFLVPMIIDFLVNQINTRPDPIRTIAEILYNAILSPSISVDEAKSFDLKFEKMTNYVYNGRVLTFGENHESGEFGLIVRGPFGITWFDITEIPQTTRFHEGVSEDSLKDNQLRRSEISFDDVGHIFPIFQTTTESIERSRPTSFLMALGITSETVEPQTLTPLKAGCESAMKEFDELCGLARFEILVTHVTSQSTSFFFTETSNNTTNSNLNSAEKRRYNRFIEDLGNSFDMGFCKFVYGDKFETGDILVIFNESDRRLNTRFQEITQFEVIIVVSPLYQTLTKESGQLTYKVSIIKCHPKEVAPNEAFKSLPLLPYTQKKTIITSKENLARTLSSICFFYYGQGTNLPTTSGQQQEPYHCPLADKYAELYKERKEKLNRVVKDFSKQQDLLLTLVDE